ncbi:MAG: TetR/AcrR family transcriptional regulator [Lachnospiraceae bacterium]
MEKKLDFRVQRTYKALQEALMALLNEKNFDDITVGELCERAMIRRATFYKHFGDKYELFAFCIRELQEQFKQKNSLEYDTKRPQTFYVSMIDYSLQFVEQHIDMIKSMLKSNSSEMLFDILSNEIEFDIRSHLREDAKNGAILPTKPGLLATLITGALIYTIKWWIVQDKPIPREELVQVFTSLIKIM